MREYVKDTEVFDFGDWVISNELNEYEVRQILKITKTFNNKLDKNINIKFDEYYYLIKDILGNNMRLKKHVNPVFVKQMLISLRKLMFKKLIAHLLNEENIQMGENSYEI